MRAPFRELFESPDDDMLALRDASFFDDLLYQTPRKHNLWIPCLMQRLMFQRRIYAKDMCALKRDNFDFEQWGIGKKCYMSSYHEITPPR